MKKTIIDLFESSVRRYPDNPFLWEKTTNAFEPTTYKEVQQQVYTAGAGLIALGVKKGDNMALLSEGRNACIIGELAMFYAGATNVPLSIKLEEANDLLFRLVHADVKYILVSGNQLKKIRSIMDKLPLVEKVILKKGQMSIFLVTNPESPYYESEAFDKLLGFIQKHPRECTLREQNGKRSIVIKNVPMVEVACNYLDEIGKVQIQK